MYIIPAIDLRDGKCVRLIQGQYDRQVNYRDNPVEQAKEFASDGAEWLHIVDLDGAKEGIHQMEAEMEWKPDGAKGTDETAQLNQVVLQLGS